MSDEMKQSNNIAKTTVKAGISFGSCLAMIISYTAWQSIPWAIFHGLLSWAYVVYYVIRVYPIIAGMTKGAVFFARRGKNPQSISRLTRVFNEGWRKKTVPLGASPIIG